MKKKKKKQGSSASSVSPKLKTTKKADKEKGKKGPTDLCKLFPSESKEGEEE